MLTDDLVSSLSQGFIYHALLLTITGGDEAAVPQMIAIAERNGIPEPKEKKNPTTRSSYYPAMFG